MKRSDSILQQFYMSNLPEYQTRGSVLPGYATPLPRSTDVPGNPKPVMQMTMADSLAKKAIANQPSIRPAYKSTDREEIIEKNRQYAASTGKRFNPNSGAVTPLFSDNTDQILRRAQENIVNPMLEIEMMRAAPGIMKKGIKLFTSNARVVGPGRTIEIIGEAPYNPEFYYIDEMGVRRAKPINAGPTNAIYNKPLTPEEMPKLYSQLTREEWKNHYRDQRIRRNNNDVEYLRKNFFKQGGGPIVDPRGQWAHPGKVTRIPGSSITMQGVPYPVFGVGNNGQQEMMYPGQDYDFGSATYVDEYPIMQKGGLIPMFQIRGEVMRAPADNTKLIIPQKSPATKAEVDYVKDQFDKSIKFHEQWMNSPMYNKMIRMSDPTEADAITRYRKENLKNIKFRYAPHQPHNEPSMAGYSESSTGNVTILPVGVGVRGLGTHETSHSIDRPDGSYFSFYKNLIGDKLFGTNKFMARAMPTTDVFRINSYSSKNRRDYGNKQWFDYVTSPTETRARLNDIRQQASENKLYDPFTQRVTPEIYNKLKSFEFEKGDKSEFDPLFQLRGVYTDDQIINLLNSVSKNNSSIGLGEAKSGGELFRMQDAGQVPQSTQNAMNEGAAWLRNWYQQRMQQPQFKEIARKRYDLLSQTPGVIVDDKDLARDRAEAAYDPVKDKFIIPSIDTRGSTDPTIWAHEFNHRTKFKAPQDFERSWVKGYSKNFLNSREAEKNHGMPRSSFMYIRNPYETEAFLTAFRKEANLDPNKSYSKEEMLEKMKPYMESPSYKDIRKQSYDEQKQHSIKRFLQLMNNDPEKVLYLHNGIVSNDRGSMIPMAQWGLEFKVDDWLGNPMEKAEKMADKFTRPGEDQTDNFRHPMAGRYTSEAIQRKTGNIPVISNILGFIGASAAGLGHELLEPNRGPETRPYTLGQTIREGAEDQFNNMVGALIGSLPFMSADKKTKALKYLSDNNLIPDGYGRNSDNMYFKKYGGQHGGLDRWFAEKWVDVKSGKPCGRQEGESRAYPACRPSRRVSSETPKTSSEMSPAEKAKFKRSKTSSERINYNHKRN